MACILLCAILERDHPLHDLLCSFFLSYVLEKKNKKEKIRGKYTPFMGLIGGMI